MTHTTDYEHVLDAANVRGVSYEADRDEVVVFVEEKRPESNLADDDIVSNQIPDTQTDVIEIGDVAVQPRHPPEPRQGPNTQGVEHRSKHEPPRAGASEIQAGSTAATAGLLATVTEPESPEASWHDTIREGDLVRLSNAHVYGDTDSEFKPDVLQPSPFDGGGPPDAVGEFVGYVPITDEFVDAAARSCDAAEHEGVLNLRDRAPEAVRRDDYAALKGEPVVKAGRTTGVTEGEILATSATITVRYGSDTITKRNQLLAGAMSDGGDSGSPVFLGGDGDGPGALVGHLFAGSDRVTVVNKAVDIETRLGVRIQTVDEQDHVSEYTFEDYVEEHLEATYGEAAVTRQHRFSNGRYADFLVEDDGTLQAWELENDSGSLVNGMGQALFYAQSALEDFETYDGAIPVLCFPEGHVDEEERPLFQRAGVVLREFEVPEEVSLKGV